MIAPNLDNFTLGKVLGLGSYAVVRLAVHKPSGQNMAIKTYEKSKLQDPQKRKNVTREMKILSKLRHNNIIKLHQAAETVQQLHLVMEYTSSNSLNSFIKAKQSRKLPEDEAKLIFR
jgi:MAP/microtubule affinity-regulating kinase